jgi:flagellar L-ring protein precursor FlgH
MKNSRPRDLYRSSVSLTAGLLFGAVVSGTGCAPTKPPYPYVPSVRYSKAPGAAQETLEWMGGAIRQESSDGRAQLRLASAEGAPALVRGGAQPAAASAQFRQVGADGDAQLRESDIQVVRSTDPLQRSYSGPLPLGDPGVTSSLWRESRAGNEVFRDFRAWQAMDLITIVVTERSRGMHDADTEVKSNSQVLTAIQHLLGFEKQTEQWKYPPDLSALVQASTQNNYKGEGMTNRQAELTARISAVVAEVLPSGLLRIEGEKIIAVNNEEQVMVISGLVRQRDVNSLNEVDSSKIAQMRIDYYGKGTVGEAQYGGWLGRLMRYLWPF